jgi:phage shock protein PspC (stress-responsive transcriptional regulator)
MKKVININFQGRVIPIEESAYDVLKQYVESLRRFFANEEGRDEIINDIEGRIAELFGETLKKGSTCITDEDVNKIIASMGRPEDFEGEESKVQSQLGGNEQQQSSYQRTQYEEAPRGRLYRDENDKILGGVCSGLASYLRVDPTIVRLVFALITFGAGTGILLYILLWIILPSKSLAQTTSSKRLYRNPEEKVIAGVASGIATYFDIAVWIPRLIFAMPLVVGILSNIFRSAFWFDFDPFPSFIFGSFGGTLFVVYAVLWAVIPEAKSASEKLEMRGEKVDLNTIKNTIQEDLEGFKTRAEKWGNEFSEKAKEFGNEFSSTVNQKSKQFGKETATVTRSGANRIGNIIAILFKAFFLFVAGVIAFALFVALMAMMTAGVAAFPLKDFFLDGFWQNFLAWSTILLFLLVPVIGILVWLIRRIIGAKAGSRYLGFAFGGLWTLGIVSAVFLAAFITQDFDARAKEKKDIAIQQPMSKKLLIKVEDSRVRVIGKWLHLDGFLGYDGDSIILNNVSLRIAKSPDSLYHVYYTKMSNGRDEDVALNNINEIHYGLTQIDSVLVLNRGFNLKKGTKFRNQSVIVTVQVPVGKKIEIDEEVSRRLQWMHFKKGNDSFDWDNEWENGDGRWSSNTEYIMTPSGRERVDNRSDDDNNSDDAIENYKRSKEELRRELERKQKETDELKKELEKAPDTVKYKYQKATSLNRNERTPSLKGKEVENKNELMGELGMFSALHMQS